MQLKVSDELMSDMHFEMKQSILLQFFFISLTAVLVIHHGETMSALGKRSRTAMLFLAPQSPMAHSRRPLYPKAHTASQDMEPQIQPTPYSPLSFNYSNYTRLQHFPRVGRSQEICTSENAECYSRLYGNDLTGYGNFLMGTPLQLDLNQEDVDFER